MRTGPLASSGLTKAIEAALAQRDRGFVAFAPFQSSMPSYDAPASFVAAPIIDGDGVVGAIAFQIPIGTVSEIISETVGMGRTGETYAVGSDRLFRSNSRFAADLGVESTILDPSLKVDTHAVREALDQGNSGTALGLDYRGTRVLSSWEPVTVHPDQGGRGAVKWALISELDELEVLTPAYRLRDWAIRLFLLTAAGVVAAAYLVSRRLSERQVDLETKVRSLADVFTAASTGDLTQPIGFSGSDDMGRLADHAGSMLTELRGLIGEISEAAAQQNEGARMIAESVSESAQSQAASVEQMTASVEELINSIEQVSRNCVEARSQAEHTAAMARQGGATVEEAIASMNLIQKSAEQVNEINEINDVIGDIANAAEAQSSNASEVKLAIRSVSQTTEGTAASAEELAAGGEELNGQAEGLKSLVQKFRT